jgi:hypothetical protein
LYENPRKLPFPRSSYFFPFLSIYHLRYETGKSAFPTATFQFSQRQRKGIVQKKSAARNAVKIIHDAAIFALKFLFSLIENPTEMVLNLVLREIPRKLFFPSLIFFFFFFSYRRFIIGDIKEVIASCRSNFETFSTRNKFSPDST